MKTLVATCGELGSLTLLAIYKEIDIIGILTDASSIKVIEWAKKRSILLFIGNPRKSDVTKKIEELGDFDILISINYLFIFEERLINLPKILSMNIHGSKLPLYRGRGPHLRAIINGEKEIGITLHKIDKECDTGDIILQRVIELSNEITGGEVLSLLPDIYPEMILEALAMIKHKSLTLLPQQHDRATYYEKIKLEEREINWNCKAIQIKNLVRALTTPYLGAFTSLKETRVVILKVNICTDKFNSKVENGEILEVSENSLKVKVSDGVIDITHYSFLENEQVHLSTGDCFVMEKYEK